MKYLINITLLIILSVFSHGCRELEGNIEGKVFSAHADGTVIKWVEELSLSSNFMLSTADSSNSYEVEFVNKNNGTDVSKFVVEVTWNYTPKDTAEISIDKTVILQEFTSFTTSSNGNAGVKGDFSFNDVLTALGITTADLHKGKETDIDYLDLLTFDFYTEIGGVKYRSGVAFGGVAEIGDVGISASESFFVSELFKSDISLKGGITDTVQFVLSVSMGLINSLPTVSISENEGEITAVSIVDVVVKEKKVKRYQFVYTAPMAPFNGDVSFEIFAEHKSELVEYTPSKNEGDFVFAIDNEAPTLDKVVSVASYKVGADQLIELEFVFSEAINGAPDISFDFGDTNVAHPDSADLQTTLSDDGTVVTYELLVEAIEGKDIVSGEASVEFKYHKVVKEDDTTFVDTETKIRDLAGLALSDDADFGSFYVDMDVPPTVTADHLTLNDDHDFGNIIEWNFSITHPDDGLRTLDGELYIFAATEDDDSPISFGFDEGAGSWSFVISEEKNDDATVKTYKSATHVLSVNSSGSTGTIKSEFSQEGEVKLYAVLVSSTGNAGELSDVVATVNIDAIK